MNFNAAPRAPENPHANQEEIVLHAGPPASQQIEAEAAAAGRSDLVGLAVADEHVKYVVIDSGIKQHVDRTAIVKRGLPRFDGLSFKRPTIKTKMRKTGLPQITGLNIPGIENVPGFKEPDLTLGVERPMVAREGRYSYEPNITVEVYDRAGDVVGLEEYTQDAFYKKVDGLGHKNAAGNLIPDSVAAIWMEPEPVATDIDMTISLPVSVTKHKDDGRGVPLAEHKSDDGFVAFDKVERTLKDHGIDSWRGLSWQYGDIVQEVVFDKGIKHDTTTLDTDKQSIRTFGIKTTHNGRTVGLEIMNDQKFARYLQRATDPEAQRAALNQPAGSTQGVHVLDRVRMVREKNDSPLADEHYRYLGWLAKPRSPQEADAAARHEAEIRNYIDTHITDESPEPILPDEDQLAVWLLDYGDVLDDEARYDEVEKMYGSHYGRLQIDRLKTLIKDHGLPVVYDTASKIRGTLLETMKTLDHPIAVQDQSLSAAMRILVDNKHASMPDLFTDNDDAQFEQNAIVSELVGRSVTRVVSEDSPVSEKALIQEKSQMRPTGKIVNNQPEVVMHNALIFNEGFFKGHDSPAISKPQIASRIAQNTLRDPVIETGHAIFAKLKSRRRNAVTQADYVEFGEMLRQWKGIAQYR